MDNFNEGGARKKASSVSNEHQAGAGEDDESGTTSS